MKRVGWIGADPGTSGAIAVWEPSTGDVDIVDMPKLACGAGFDHWTLGETLRTWVERYAVQGVTVERVSAMPGQGVTSMFSFGESFGALKQAIASAGMRFTLVQPSVWKVIYGLRGGRENKADSVRKAIELFPALKGELVGPKGGLKDGRAEAVLLAHYGSKLRNA